METQPITKDEWDAWRAWCAKNGVHGPCETLSTLSNGERSDTHFRDWISRRRLLSARLASGRAGGAA